MNTNGPWFVAVLYNQSKYFGWEVEQVHRVHQVRCSKKHVEPVEAGAVNDNKHMDGDKCKAKVFDDGNHKFSATTLATIGLATVRILQKADDPRVKNKLVYVQSIQTTQNDLISTVESVTGKKYEVEKVNSDAFVKENKDHLEKDKGNAETIEELVTVEGLVNADWTTKGDAFVVDFLGLPAESLDDLVRRALK